MRRHAFLCLLAILLVLSAMIGPRPAAARPAALARHTRTYLHTSAPSFGNPYLVEDTTTAGFPEGGNPFGYAVLSGSIYFVADTPGTGQELWRSSGHITDTAMVTEIYPGAERGVDSPPYTFERTLVNYGGRLYFAGHTAERGIELWATDGTPSGTVLVRDIATGTERSEPELLIVYNSELYFAANDHARGDELWKTDGTYTGTVLVKDAYLGTSSANIEEIVTYAGRLWFNARSSGQGDELWVSDGTVTGTTQFISIASGNNDASPEALTTAGGLLYFTADTPSAGRELWRTDGTVTGTFQLRDINPGTDDAFIYESPAAGYGYLFFSAYDPTYGTELWRSDGTTNTVTGTVRVADIYTGTNGSSPSHMTPFNGAVYFWADDGVNNDQLWRTTLTVTEIVPNPTPFNLSAHGDLFAHGGYLYFAADDATYGRELWRYDGSAFTRLTDLNPGLGNSSPDGFYAPNANNIFFVANNGVNGYEPYRLNLLTGAITSLGNLAPDAVSSNIDELTGAGADQAYFELYNTTHGSEPYGSDGTPAGTGFLGDLYPGNGGSNPAPFAGLGDGRALFDSYSNTTGNEPWVSDGTLTGTLLLRDIYTGTSGSNPEGFIPVAGGAAFFADDGVLGDELWFTDGTPGGTVFVRDIYTGAANSFGGDFGSLPGLMLFAADDGVHGEELWATDGTYAGTTRLTDLDSGSYQDLYPYDFVTAGDRLFFIGYDLEGNDSLYVTNGLTATLVIDPDDTGLTSFNNLLAGATGVYFEEYSSPDLKYQIWWTDGYTYTQRTTFTSTQETVSLQSAVTAGDRLFFRYCDLINGCELWSLTPASPAALVRDIYPGLQSSDPTDFAAVDGHVIFAAADPIGGREMWISDGTFDGTQRLADIAPGLGHSNPEQMTVSGDRLFFTAYSEAAGYELWVMDLVQKLFLPLLSR